MKRSKKKQDDEYCVDFQGARLTKLEANRIGVGIIFGIFGVVLLFLLPIEPKGPESYILLVFCVFVGYFLVSPFFFKKNKKDSTEQSGHKKEKGPNKKAKKKKKGSDLAN